MENSSTSENSLHLDFNASLNLNDFPKNEEAESTAPASSEDAPAASSLEAESKDRKKPYVNPERVKTGGSQRVSSCIPQHSSLLTA